MKNIGAWTLQHDPPYEQPGQIGDFAGSFPEEYSTGTLTSSTFTIDKDYLDFRIGGQDNANANKVRLIVNGNMKKETYPPHDNGFVDISWSVSSWIDSSAYIECVDGNSNGSYQIVWDVRNELGHQISSGIYFYRIIAGPMDET